MRHPLPLSSSSSFLLPAWRPLLTAFSHLLAAGPFDPTWDPLLTAAWSLALTPSPTPASASSSSPRPAPSSPRRRVLSVLSHALTECALVLRETGSPDPADLALYQSTGVYFLGEQFSPHLQSIIDEDRVDVPFLDPYLAHYRHLFGYPGVAVPDAAHLLALHYQARRAWYFPALKILGRSPSAAAARAAIGRANMGADLCTYADGLYRCMDEIPVLITGETGTGKELAAECIGWSRYIPFDPVTRRFARRYAEDFHARNLCEVPVELRESALFGHRRGAFTGATADSPGLFGLARPGGTLFLDEAGELPPHLQVKLLRPFQSRDYFPVGEVKPRKLQGRLVFATNRDLEALCRAGDFRADLLERMNGVHVHMPSLRTMLDEAPGELAHYVRAFVTARIDAPARAERLVARVVESIRATRPHASWSRNVRELKNYTERFLLTDARSSPTVVVVIAPASPPAPTTAVAPVEAPPPEPQTPAATASASASTPAAPESTCLPSSKILGEKAKAGEVLLKEVNRDLVTRVHVLSDGNMSETARKLGVDRRTIKRLLDPARLKRLRKDPEE